MNQEPNPVASMKSKYEPPRVVAISLRPEEAVLGHCKMSILGSSGPGSSVCVVLLCSSVGS
jgi:hypothetical protein